MTNRGKSDSRLVDERPFARLDVRVAAEPVLSRVEIDGKLLPVARIEMVANVANRETDVVLHVPLRFVNLTVVEVAADHGEPT